MLRQHMCHLLFRTKREQLNKAFSTYSVDSILFLDIVDYILKHIFNSLTAELVLGSQHLS